MLVLPYWAFLYPAILWVILFFVGRHRGDTSYSTLFFVSLGISIVAFLSAIYIPTFALPVTAIAGVLIIQKFCYVGWFHSILATVLFIGWMFAWPHIFHS